MKNIIKFIKTTALGGLLVIVPVAVVVFVLAQLFMAVHSVTETVVESTGITRNQAILVFVLALLAMVGICFVTGLLLRTGFGSRVGHWFNEAVAPRIPMYRAVSNLTKAFVGEESEQFQPVEIDLFASDARAIGFLVEELPDGRKAVFVPSAPVATVGNVYLVPASSLRAIRGTVRDTTSVIAQWGVEASRLIEDPRAAEPQKDDAGEAAAPH